MRTYLPAGFAGGDTASRGSAAKRALLFSYGILAAIPTYTWIVSQAFIHVL